MSRSGYLKEHLAAWSLCAAIFAAMVALSPVSGTDAAGAKAEVTSVATAPEGVRDARGQRWQPAMSLTGQSNPWKERWAEAVDEERTFWASGTAPSRPDLVTSKTICQAGAPAGAS